MDVTMLSNGLSEDLDSCFLHKQKPCRRMKLHKTVRSYVF